MSATTLTSEQLLLRFGENPLAIDRITHRGSGEDVCRRGEQLFLLRFPLAPSDPVFLDRLVSAEMREDEVVFTVTDEDERHRATCRIAPTPDGLRFQFDVAAAEPVWMAEWRLSDVDLLEIIVPALGGQVLTDEMPAETEVVYKYPFWWNAQFVLGSIGRSGGVWLRTKQVAPAFKMLRVHRVEERHHLFSLGLGFEADGAHMSNTLSAEWYVDGYTGSWKNPVDVHRAWLEEAFGLVPYREHPHFPAWAADVNFVLEIWGMSKESPKPRHTFDDMIERIRTFAELHPPGQTLLYLPAFAEHGIDSNAPDYNPSPRLGGREGFKQLVDEAHALGYRVMIHTNVLAMTYTHPLFERFREHQVVDPFGRVQGWGNDLDGDWLHEPYFAYINPGAEAWGELMTEVIGGLVTAFGLDAVFLDQTLLAFNTSRGPNFLEGMRRHIERLQRAHPQVLFAGEGLHEQVLAALPMAQIHGIDSIAGIHGMEGRMEWRRVHPVSTYLFGKYTRFVAHLLTRHPSSSTFRRQEAAYTELGVLPALVLYRRSQEVDIPAVRKMLKRARRLHRATQEPVDA